MDVVEQDNVLRNKSRKSFLMVIAAFLLPILVAKLALQLNWLDYGVTNKGELLTTELTIADFGLELTSDKKEWLMIYLLPKNCDELCQQVLVGVNNTYIALGSEIGRVTPVGLYQTALSETQLSTIRVKDWQLTPASNKALTNANLSKLYLVDPLGNIFMSHQLPTHAEEIASFGKAVVADMKKVLKYSKVG